TPGPPGQQSGAALWQQAGAGSRPPSALALLARRGLLFLLGMDALGKHLLPGGAIPLLVLLVRDLALDEQLRELATLRLALEGHEVRLARATPAVKTPVLP